MSARRWSLIGALLLGVASASPERIVTGDGVVAAQVNGAAARLRIDPGAPAMPMLSAELAKRAELEAGRLDPSYAITVGPTLIAGHSAVAAIGFDGVRVVHRVAWNERHYQGDVDGVIGPGSLHEPVVRFQLRAPRPGERTRALPLLGDGGIDDFGPSYATVPFGDTPLRIRFSPRVARSWLDASTANRVASMLGGRFGGAAQAEEIAFGVARPVRPLLLAHPLVIGPLSLSRVGVRTADGADTGAIPDVNAPPPPPPDPDEVVVTARPGRKRPGTLVLGADALARCSSVVFDKTAGEVRLTCG